MQNQFITDSCITCHPQPHRLQRLLAEGLKRKDVPATPGFHFKVSATCMACHLESQISDKGEKVLKASAKSCVACHKGRENLLDEWKADLELEIKFTKEVEQEALDALTPAKLSEPKLAEAWGKIQTTVETVWGRIQTVFKELPGYVWEKIKQVGKDIIEHVDPRTIYGPHYREAASKIKLCDISKARELGWSPGKSLDDIIVEVAEYFRVNRDIRDSDVRDQPD